jgi:hypothetical protein
VCTTLKGEASDGEASKVPALAVMLQL